MNRSRIILYALLALFFTLQIFGSVVNGLFTDWLWFKQIGYATIFTKILGFNVLLGALTALAFFIFLYSNALLAKKMAPPPTPWRPMPNDPHGNTTLHLVRTPEYTRLLNIAIFGASVVFAFGVGLSAASYWDVVLKYINQVPFGVKDPVFNLDIAFHMFSIPFYRFLLSFGFQAVIFSIIAVVVIYVLRSGIDFRQGINIITPHFKAHLSVLLGVFFLLLAVSFRLNAYDLLLSKVGVVFGAGYTDIHARMPALTILSIASVITAILFLVNLHYRGWKLPIFGIVFILAVGILAGGIYPTIIQQYSVSPNEIAKETPYIKNAIRLTNLAYGLDKIKERPFAAEAELNTQVLNNNTQTIDNIRLWDWKPLLKTYNQIQSIRLYYDFMDVDVDRYPIDGTMRQVAISPRELKVDNLPENAQTWINQHLVYTHGYGIVANRVNEFTEDGLPSLVVKDIPPKTEVNSLKVTRPEIYFGEEPDEGQNNYVIIDTKTREFDYPMGNANKYTKYQGEDGVKIDGLVEKVAFAWRFGTLKILLADSLTERSKIIFYRNVIDRVDRIAPFLDYESDPYIVVDKGRLYWMLDAYTTDNRYPYSHPFDGNSNYIRNSVKVVVDAYNGDVSYYVFDTQDPIIRTYQKAFPGLFKDMKNMPSGLARHVRYPETMFTIQSKMFAAFHMTDPQVFYNKEDLWTISQESLGGEKTEVEPYYMEMKLPGEKDTKFMALTTYTPSNKDNMIAWLAAKCDPEEYGQMLVYTFPKQKLIYGPTQIEARINQTPDISGQLTLWNQQGSRAIRGTIFVIPIEDSILYVEPLYLQAEQTELPELKRIIVAYGSKIVMEPTFGEALDAIFGKGTGRAQPRPGGGPTKPETPSSLKELIDKASQLFDDSQEKQRNGDWAGYGEDVKKLEDTLDELKRKSAQE